MSMVGEQDRNRTSGAGSATAPRGSAPAESVAPGDNAARPLRATLGQQLIGADIITAEQLELALAEGSQKGMRLGEALVEMGMVQEDAILPFIEGHLGVPALRLRDGIIDPIAVRILPRRVAEALDSIALFKVRGTLCVAMADPQNLEQLDEIERVTGLKIRPVFAFRSSIQRTLPRCYEEGFEVDAVTADLDEAAVQLQADAAEVDLTNVESMVDGSPIINRCNTSWCKPSARGRAKFTWSRAASSPWCGSASTGRCTKRCGRGATCIRHLFRASRSWPRWTSPSTTVRRTAGSK
jgi:type IV pilus assembly protein PilB